MQVNQNAAPTSGDSASTSDDPIVDVDRALDAARLKHAWMIAAIAEANAESARVAPEIAALEARKATLNVAMLAMAQGHQITVQ